jgi:replication factor A1
VEVRDGWQEDLEASAGWRSSLTVRDPPAQADAATESATLAGFGEPDEPADDAATGPGSFTGTVVQVGSPVILDDGTATQQVETDATVRLGEQLTVHGEVVDGRLHAEQIERV